MLISAAWFLVPAIVVGPAADEAAPAARDLDALAARLRGPVASDRLAAARAIAGAAPAGFDLYVERLRRPPTIAADTLRKLILETWAQVPNPNYAKDGQLWTHKPEPPWKPPPVQKGERRPKRPPPHDPEKVEWLAALNDLDLDGNPELKDLPDRAEARAAAMEAVALMRAIAAAGRTDGMDPIFDFAFVLDGVMRDECGRTIRSMESRAIPGLIRRMHVAGKGIALYRQRRYASYQLDRMDRASPLKAISGTADDRVRAEILHAYGEVRAIEAVEAILGQVDASSRRVRNEARWAWLRYVTGPPPPEAPKRKRKLPGGRAETEEKEDYLNYREMAVLALGRTLAEIRGEPFDPDEPPPTSEAKKLTDELFAWYDARRATSWSGLFDAAAGKEKAGDLEGAVGDFQWILAHDPFYERRAEMAPVFVRFGESLLEREPAQAALLLRQALLLAPELPGAQRIEAELHLLDGLHRLGGGDESRFEFERALALDPSLARARQALRELEMRRGRRDRAALAAFGSVGGAFVLLILLLARRALRRA
jgi:hypothetical protein